MCFYLIRLILKQLIIILLIAFASSVHAETSGWITKDGAALPNSDFMKSVNGFGGALVVTPDLDWKKKWNTSPETIPSLSLATDVKYGDRLSILIFYANPQTNASGQVDLLCDVKISGPDGRVLINEKAIQCAAGKLQGDPRNTRLAASIMYVPQGRDRGECTVEITVTDTISGTKIPLKETFTVR